MTSSKEKNPRSSSTLILNLDSVSSSTLVRVHTARSKAYSSGCHYIFLTQCVLNKGMFMWHFYDISTSGGCLSSVLIRRIIYKFSNACPFDYTAFAVRKRWRSRKSVYHTSWVVVAAPIDRLKSVRNRCVIGVFGGYFVLSLCFFYLSVGIGTFVVRLSQISFFFSFSFSWILL